MRVNFPARPAPKRALIAAALLCMASLAGCGSDPKGGPEATAGPTWHGDIAPVVTARCSRCHNAEDALTFPLTTYEQVAPLASWMLTKMQGDDTPPYIMPPFGARDTEECTPPAPWKNDPRVTEAELALFTAWVDAGAPEGDPSTATDLTSPEPAHLTGDGVQTYSTAGAALEENALDDQYLCFPIDLDSDEASWITGLEVIPENKGIAHHAVVFTDPRGEGAAMAGSEGSYPCFGGSGATDSSVLFAWAPGADPFELSPGMGAPVPEGGKLIVQMHYHPTGTAEYDTTQVAVRTAAAEPEKTAQMAVFGASLSRAADSERWEDPPFEVPANAEQHVETWVEDLDIPAGADVRLFGVFPHMHLAGTDIRISIERDGEDICLSHDTSWDFEWQLTYMYDGGFEALPRLLPGDRVRVRCTYNNTMSNPILSEYTDTPTDIGLGEDTFDEMCIGFLGVAY